MDTISPPTPESSPNMKQSLDRLLFETHRRSSFIPVLVVTSLLMTFYFWGNRYLTLSYQDAVLTQAKESFALQVRSEAEKITQQLKQVSCVARIVQDENTNFFLASEAFPLPAGEPVFAVASSGIPYKAVDNGGCSLFYGRRTKITEVERKKARDSEIFDPLFKSVCGSNPLIVAIYFNSFDHMNRYYPFIPDVRTQYDPDLRMQDFNFYYLADREHNPSRVPVWTGAYLDPAGQGWMVSCITPIYRGEFLEGVTGLDVTIETFVKHILDLKLPFHAGTFMVDRDGMILAMSAYVENYLDIVELKHHIYNDNIKIETLKPDEYNLKKLSSRDLAAKFAGILDSGASLAEVTCPGGDALVFQAPVSEAGWRLMILVDRNEIYLNAQAMGKTGRNLGFLVLGILGVACVLFYFILSVRSRKFAASLAQPIRELSDATSKIGTQEALPGFDETSIEEIDQLASNFVKMGTELESRTKALIDSQLRERMREKESELAFTAGLFESASSYLHNIGNALARMDGNIHDLQDILASMEQFPRILATISETLDRLRNGDADGKAAEDLVSRLEAFLVGKLKPGFETSLARVSDIRNHMAHSIKLQLDSFNDSTDRKSRFVQELNLTSIVEYLVSDFKPSFEKRNIRLNIILEPDVLVATQKHQLIHGFTNLIKNAIEAIDGAPDSSQGRISIALERIGTSPRRARFTISDNGLGMDEEDMKFLFSSGFTTKLGGHGLGLRSFSHFLKYNNGSITAKSEGRNRGITFTVEVGDE